MYDNRGHGVIVRMVHLHRYIGRQGFHTMSGAQRTRTIQSPMPLSIGPDLRWSVIWCHEGRRCSWCKHTYITLRTNWIKGAANTHTATSHSEMERIMVQLESTLHGYFFESERNLSDAVHLSETCLMHKGRPNEALWGTPGLALEACVRAMHSIGWTNRPLHQWWSPRGRCYHYKHEIGKNLPVAAHWPSERSLRLC